MMKPKSPFDTPPAGGEDSEQEGKQLENETVFKEAVSKVYTNTPEIQNHGSLEEYLRHASEIRDGLKPNEHRVTHTHTDLGYHGAAEKFEKFRPSKRGLIYHTAAKDTIADMYKKGEEGQMLTLLVNGDFLDAETFIKEIEKYPEVLAKFPEELRTEYLNLNDLWKRRTYYNDAYALGMLKDFDMINAVRDSGFDGTKFDASEVTVGAFDQTVTFEPNNIHILGSKGDIELFKESVSK